MPNLYLRWCLCFPADSCPGKGKGDTQEEEKARWHSQAASGSGGEGIFVRKTHVSANFPAESWPQSSGRENLLPFMRHFCRRAVRRVRPRGLAVQGGGPRETAKSRKTQGWMEEQLGSSQPNSLGLMVAKAATFPLVALVAGGYRELWASHPPPAGTPQEISPTPHTAGRDKPAFPTQQPRYQHKSFGRWDKQPSLGDGINNHRLG